MASMREIKSRMKSIKETRQITKAMKLISAAKLKKARQQLEQTLPYFDKVKLTIADIIMHSGNIDNIFFDPRNEKEGRKKCYVVITGDKGLAGGYNHNIIKLAESVIDESENPRLLVAGHMGRSHFMREKSNVDLEFDYPVQNPTVYRAKDVATQLLEMFKNGEVDEVFLIYTHMVSAIRLEPRVMQILPLTIESLRADLEMSEVKIDERLSYEPSPQAVYDVLIPKYIKGIIYGALVEAFTSEQSARMSAMDNATANADDMLMQLNLYYNRARQAAITQEISEIVGGAAALE